MGGFKKGIWIARDENGELYAYVAKPIVFTSPITKLKRFGSTDANALNLLQLPSSWYKNLKFKNSPVFIPIPEQLVEQQIK